MKIDGTNQRWKIAAAVLFGIAISPVLAFAARTATPFVSSLFPSNQIYVNLPAPIVTMAASSTPGSVNAGTALFIEVTALDGAGGETFGSNMVSTSTTAGASYNITWSAVQGAVGYRIYFSTSTSQAFTQYFVATSTTAYRLTATTSPTFTSGLPSSNTAYVISLYGAGTSWVNGGNFGIGTSTPKFSLSVSNQPPIAGTVATTTSGFGDQATSSSRTCFNVNTSAGTAGSFYMNAAGALVGELNACR